MADDDAAATWKVSIAMQAESSRSKVDVKGDATVIEEKRGRSSYPVADVGVGSSTDVLAGRKKMEDVGDVHHDDLEAYRETRRMSRNSSRMRLSSASYQVEPEQGPLVPGKEGDEGSTSLAPAREPRSKEETSDVNGSKTKHTSGPVCLVRCTEKIEACTESIQAWTDRLEDDGRRKKDAKRDAAVIIAEDGSVIEPKGDSWLQRKIIVFVVFIILFWVYIVYVWRICAAGIQMDDRATYSRNEAIVLLVGFHTLWLMVIWSYIRVLLASPGYVRDHIAISDPPPPINEYYPNPTNSSQDTSVTSPRTGSSDDRLEANAEAPNEERIDPTMPAMIGPLGAGQAAAVDEERVLQTAPSPQAYWATHNQQASAMTEGGIAEPMRVPPQSAPLHPVNTYCYRCKRYKPHRAHHCRHCATCVLKMDHHCPWVGGCVGARNHKFFYHFLQWVTMLELYVLISNAIAFARGLQRRQSGVQDWSIDGYMISLFPICAMFLLFTGALVITHSYLFILNLTTIEHMAYSRITTREEILLSRYLDAREDNEGRKLDFRQKIKEKGRIKKKWALQWGNLKSEANLWWLDNREEALKSGQPRNWYHSIRPNVQLALGDRWYEWILPLGRSKSDGLSYETNWRFGQGGLWRTREEWSDQKKES